MARTMRSSSLAVEAWAVIEGIFYVCLVLHRKWLNSLDTLELSLRSAPMLEARERAELWEFMMDSEEECVEFITGWFSGIKLEMLTKYDIMDFMSWSLFEGRNIEHLTHEELHQLRGFVSDLEYKISIELYGARKEGEESQGKNDTAAGKEEMEVDEIKTHREDGKTSIATEEDGEDNALVIPPSPKRQHFMQHYGVQPGYSLDDAIKLKRKANRQKPNKCEC